MSTPFSVTNPQTLAAQLSEHASIAAPALLGCLLTVTTPDGEVTVRITEVEAYGGEGEDPGAHSWGGKTPRNASLFGPSQRVYIYLSYGIHRCLNLVADDTAAGGVLLRAADVVSGHELVVARRGGRDTGSKLLSGPGRLGQGLAIELDWDGADLQLGESGMTDTHDAGSVQGTSGSMDALAKAESPSNSDFSGVEFRLRPPTEPVTADQIMTGPRVGVSGVGGSEEFPWRFWLKDRPSVSPYRPGKNIPPKA